MITVAPLRAMSEQETAVALGALAPASLLLKASVIASLPAPRAAADRRPAALRHMTEPSERAPVRVEPQPAFDLQLEQVAEDVEAARLAALMESLTAANLGPSWADSRDY